MKLVINANEEPISDIVQLDILDSEYQDLIWRYFLYKPDQTKIEELNEKIEQYHNEELENFHFDDFVQENFVVLVFKTVEVIW